MVHKSKSKGNKFENKIYKDLREIIPSLKLTIGSGNSEADADLISNQFIIECKHYKKVTPKLIDRWCKKLLRDAKQQKTFKTPLLIYKQNYKPTMVVRLSNFNEYRQEYKYEIFKDVLKIMGINREL